MPQEVIEVTQREVEIIEVIERGPVGPTGPQPDINYEVVSSARTLEAADLIAADTSGGAFTLTLPANPSNGDAVDIFDFSETFDTNPLTIARNGSRIESLEENLVCNVEGAYFTLIYTGSTRGWQVLPRYGTSGGGGESALTTQGDMLYRGAAVNTRLGIGTAGQILKVNSSATAPEWGAAPATGVTSVGITGSDGIEVDSGSPVTGSGSIALGVNAATLRSHINVADGAEVNVQSNWTEANSGSDAFILNKPTLGTAAAQDSTAFAAAVHTHTPSEVGLGNVSNTAQVTSVTGTAPIVSSGGTTPAISISAATTSAAGSMSSADKTKLDGIAAGAEVNVNADWNAASGDAQILNKPASFTPTAHAASHAAAGSDPVSPSSIGAQSIFELASTATNVGTLTASRAKIWTLVDFTNSSYNLKLPRTNAQVGDIVVIRLPSITDWGANSQVTIGYDFEDTPGVPDFFPLVTISTKGVQYRYQCTVANSFGASYSLIDVDTHTHAAADITSGNFGNISFDGKVGSTSGLPLKTGSAGVVEAGAFGTSAGQFAEGDHTHTQLHDRSHAMTSASDHTAGTHKVFYSDGSGNVQELALGATGTVLTSGGTATAPSFEAASGGVTAVGASAADILSVSGSDIVADDLGSDKLYGWDDSESKAIGFTIGSGLSVSGDTLSATATGTIGGSTGATDNLILRSDGTGAATLQNSALQLDDATTSTQANVAIVNAHSETNSALVLTPKGTGAFIVGPKPDGTSTGGNARGANSVDLQRDRNGATQVASGANSVICGGFRNTANGTQGVVVGGEGNVASATRAAVVCGSGSLASGSPSIVGAGQDLESSAAHSGTFSGLGNISSASRASVLGGERGLADRYAMQAHASGQFAANGDAQRARFVLRCKTTTNAAVEMALNGTTTYLTIPSGKVIFCNIKVVGVKSDGSAVATYERQYAAKNVAGTSSEVYAAVTIGTDNAASTSLAISTEDTGDYISIKPTGIASETWRWVASVDAVEVAYGS